MITLKIQHRTKYRYGKPVRLQTHRLMLRPREGRDLRLLSSHVTITPDATLAWSQDVAGNAIAMASFRAMTDHLSIDSVTKLELEAARMPVFNIAASAISYPFRYSGDDWSDLGALTVQQYPDATMELLDWARTFVHGNPTDTLSLLKDINAWIPVWIAYESRNDEGTQTPAQTLNRRRGSCRDLAVLLVEVVRSLGFGARLVSGYLYNPDQAGMVPQTTHAWAEIYVSGAGWITFDTTNATVGGSNLIPVAVGRDIRQIAPVSGCFIGMSEDLQNMSAEVFVTS